MKPTNQPTAKPPLADVWQTNLESVLHGLLVDGVQVVTLELASEPDATGRFKLLVRKCQCELCQPTALPSSHRADATITHDDLVLTSGV